MIRWLIIDHYYTGSTQPLPKEGQGTSRPNFVALPYLTFVVDATRRWHPELMMPGGPIARPCVKAKGYRKLSEALISFRSRGQHYVTCIGLYSWSLPKLLGICVTWVKFVILLLCESYNICQLDWLTTAMRFTPTLCPPQKKRDYIFYNNFNNRCLITIIFGIISSKSMRHQKMVSFPTLPI